MCLPLAPQAKEDERKRKEEARHEHLKGFGGARLPVARRLMGSFEGSLLTKPKGPINAPMDEAKHAPHRAQRRLKVHAPPINLPTDPRVWVPGALLCDSFTKALSGVRTCGIWFVYDLRDVENEPEGDSLKGINTEIGMGLYIAGKSINTDR